MRRASGLLIIAAALAGAQVPQDAGPRSKSYGAIEGQVLDASTGMPISGAQVGARKIEETARQTEQAVEPPKPTLPSSGTSDESGAFALVGLEAGQYRLWASHDGYARTEFGAAEPSSPGKPVEVKPGDEASFVLRLLPGAVVSGKVMDPEGKPMPDVPVQALRNSYARGFRELTAVAGATSGKKGEYRIKGLPPGRYYLAARPLKKVPAEPEEHKSEEVTTDTPTVFCPGVPDVSAASPVDAYPAADVGDMNITIGATAAYSIRGRVLNPASRSGQYVTIVRLDRDDQAIPSVTVYLRGSDAFEFAGVPPGPYTVVAQWLEGEDRYTGRQPVILGNSDVHDFKIGVAKGAPVTGTVRYRGRDTALAAPVTVQLESMQLAAGSRLTAEVKGGRFGFPEAPADRYKLRVDGAPANAYVSAVRLGGRDLPEVSTFELQGFQAQLEILLDDDGGEITAVVLDDSERPVEEVQVVAVPERRRELLFYRQAETTSDGSARVAGLAPGKYHLYAWRAIQPGAYYDPEFLRGFEREAVSVQLGPGGHEIIKMRISRRR